MSQRYKICFLGYGQITDMGQDTLSKFSWPDTDILLLNCTPETVSTRVEDAKKWGCQIFVAGSANAAEFKRTCEGYLVELPIRDIDYLVALRTALEYGKLPGIVIYQHAKRPDTALYSKLLQAPIKLLTYKNAEDLHAILSQSECDVIIGASHAVETAKSLGIKSVLVYPGEKSILEAFKKAQSLSKEIYNEQRHQAMLRALVNTSTLGIILCDETGKITLFNQTAQQYTGLTASGVRGHSVDALLPTMKIQSFIRSGQYQEGSSHLIFGAMYQCTKTRIELNHQLIGVLITFQAGGRKKKKEETSTESYRPPLSTFSDWLPCFHSLDAFNEKAQQYSMHPVNLAILGEPGSGREWLSQCIHNASPRSNEPFLTVNLASIDGEQAGRLFFGWRDELHASPGILDTLNHGTLVLKDISLAHPKTLSCLSDVLSSHEFFRFGENKAQPLNIRIILLATPEEFASLSYTMQNLFSSFQLHLPAIYQHPDDIITLFQHTLMRQTSGFDRPEKLSKQMQNLLLFYHWPGNLYEMTAVCQRYLHDQSHSNKCTPRMKYRMLFDAIGEEALFDSLLLRYPVLRDLEHGSQEDLQAAIAAAKEIFLYNNTDLSNKLGLSRTTLWRRIHSSK